MEDDLPKFDPLANCVKCGNSIPEPEKIPEPAVPPIGAPKGGSKPAAKPGPKKEEAAAPTPQAPGFALPPKPAPADTEFCSGAECPWGPEFEALGEHMHTFCQVCGYEWLSRPLDWKNEAL